MARAAPPAGPPWDLSLDEAPLAFVDLEMTGLDVSKDRVVEICVERVQGAEVVGRIATLVLPSADNGRVGGAAHVHGIDQHALAGAPPFSSVAEEVIGLLEGAIFVAHAAEWDARFLAAEFARLGVTFARDHYLDTLVLARRAFAFPSYSLDALCKSLDIDRGQAHRAESDVRALRSVFAHVVAELAPKTARDLWEVKVGERRARAAIVDACEAAAKYGAPVELVYRASGRPPEPMAFVVQQVRSDLDPPRVMGYQLPGRGRRELRADRILRIVPQVAIPGGKGQD